MGWLKKYAEGGIIQPNGWVDKYGDTLPKAQKGKSFEDITRVKPITSLNNYSTDAGIMNKIKRDANAREIERRIHNAAKETVIGQGKKSTPYSEKLRVLKNKASIIGQPNVQIDEQGNTSRINQNRGYEGNAENFMSQREDKAGEHAIGALEAASIVMPAGQLVEKGLKVAGKYLTEQTALKNAYKLNPYAFKPNPEMMYRGIGKEGMEDALESGVFRAKQNVEPSMYNGVDMSKQFNGTYYTPKFETASQYGKGFIAEVPKDATSFRLRYKGKGNKTWSQIADENIPINKGRILEKHWLKRYKEVSKPTTPEDLVDLYRIQQKGAKPFAQLAAEGKIPQVFNKPEILARKAAEEKYFGQWFTKDKNDLNWYLKDREFTNPEIINLKVPKSKLSQYQQYDKTLSRAPDREFVIPFEDQKIFNVAENSNPTSSFKSEIDWAKWNKEIPENKALMQEYNTIEQQAKANGTWMKNPDGSPFQGTPEQFVQQNSQNFKKAFGNSKLVNPDGSPTIQYHGSAKKFDAFDESKFQLGDSGYSGRGIYTTPSKNKAESYALSSKSIHKDGNYEPTVYELYGQGNNPISAEDLIKQKKDYDLFNFHRTKDWRGDVPLEEQMLDYDVAIRNQTRGIERVSPWYQADELVFPRNTQLKSAIGNNGMFDMTNPNIYKAIIPATVGVGLLQKKQKGGMPGFKEKTLISPKEQGGTINSGWLNKY